MVTNKKNYLNKNEERVKNYLKTGLYLTDNEIKKKREDKQRKGLSLTLYHFTDKKIFHLLENMDCMDGRLLKRN